MMQIGEDEERVVGDLGMDGEERERMLLHFFNYGSSHISSFLSSDINSPQLRFLHYFLDYKIVYNLLPNF